MAHRAITPFPAAPEPLPEDFGSDHQHRQEHVEDDDERSLQQPINEHLEDEDNESHEQQAHVLATELPAPEEAATSEAAEIDAAFTAVIEESSPSLTQLPPSPSLPSPHPPSATSGSKSGTLHKRPVR